MRLPELQRILIDGVRRQEQAPAPVRRTRLGSRRALTVVLALLLLGGTTAAAVVTLSRSRPLSGTLAHGPGGLGVSRYRISVFPYMNVGWSGWCSSAVFYDHRGRRMTDYGCAPVESGGPTIACCSEFGDSSGEYTYGIVSDAVASVRWEGAVVQPIASPGLPPGTRAYFMLARRRYGRLGRLPRLFASSGLEIPDPPVSRQNAVEHLPQTSVNPSSPGTARCAVRTSSVPHLVPLSETLTAPVQWPRHQPGAFLACANATYRLGASMLGLAVLLDASDVRRSPPALPELQWDPAHPGLFTGHELGNIGFPQGLSVGNFGGGQPFNTPTRAQEFANHDVTARREGAAWIVAEGGTPIQRATLLAHVSTSP
jgi:hypothetical protein